MRLEIEWLDLTFAREFNVFAFGAIPSVSLLHNHANFKQRKGEGSMAGKKGFNREEIYTFFHVRSFSSWRTQCFDYAKQMSTEKDRKQFQLEWKSFKPLLPKIISLKRGFNSLKVLFSQSDYNCEKLRWMKPLKVTVKRYAVIKGHKFSRNSPRFSHWIY